MSQLVDKLRVILADTYALYLKTQNYHWHVTGAQFKSLHELFDTQYHELADAVDEIAERIIIKGHHAPASFSAFEQLKTIQDGHHKTSANQMLVNLTADHQTLIQSLHAAMILAQKEADEGTVNLLANRLESHEKAHWMLSASQEK